MTMSVFAVSEEAADISAVAALMAHPTRAAILAALVGGGSLTAGELARIAGVSASTASEHLARLLEDGMLSVVSSGRHRYFRLSDTSVAHALEAVSAAAPPRPASMSPRRPSAEMRFARSCYDHMAGILGVGIAQALVERGLLIERDGAFELTPTGTLRLDALGVDVEHARGLKRRFSPTCLDWTERRFHLAGGLGAALLARFLEARWVARRPDGRALRVTVSGHRMLQREFDIELARAP